VVEEFGDSAVTELILGVWCQLREAEAAIDAQLSIRYQILSGSRDVEVCLSHHTLALVGSKQFGQGRENRGFPRAIVTDERRYGILKEDLRGLFAEATKVRYFEAVDFHGFPHETLARPGMKIEGSFDVSDRIV